MTPIDTATNTAGAPITVGGPFPKEVAITPDGKTAYVTNWGSGITLGTVTPIDTATNTAGAPIVVGVRSGPWGVAVTPDSSTAYVGLSDDDSVTPINIATNTAGTPIPVGSGPHDVAITPDGTTAYVTNSNTSTVTPINTAINTEGPPIFVGSNPQGVAITPDGKTVYVANSGSGTVTPIDTAGNTVGAPLATGTNPAGVAITPDQAPSAALSLTGSPASQPSSFDGSASSSPVGSIASYQWSFGDGQTATTTSPRTTHVYALPGAYTVRLTVTNTAGTSTQQVFTGQTVSLRGGPQASTTRAVTIAPATLTPAPLAPLAPTLTGLGISSRKVSIAGRRGGRRCVKPTKRNNANRPCRRPIKLNIRYTLNTADTVTLTLERQASGRKSGGRCVRPTKKNSKHKHCWRWVAIHGQIKKTGKAGVNGFTFNGVIGGHKLGPGSYQLIATPSGGTPRKTTFRIVG